MKKFFIAVMVSFAIMPVVSLTSNSADISSNAPDKYELGTYEFSFKKEDNSSLKDIETNSQDVKSPASVVNETPKTIEVKSTSTINTQKEIVKQVKQDADVVKKDIKDFGNDINSATEIKTEEAKKSIEKEVYKADENIDKVKENAKEKINKEKDSAEQTLDKSKVETKKLLENTKKPKSIKPEKPIKYDKDKPPVRFQINQIPYEGSSSSKIERL